MDSMKKKNRIISEDTLCLENVAVKDNIVKGVKILGVNSKNGRVYPLEVMRKSLHKYNDATVFLDHPSHDKPRSVQDVFARIRNPRMTDTGIVGDFEYNYQHPYAKAFEYFVNNDPSAIGLSHAAIAKTKMDRNGTEIVEDIVEVESVDLVANPATNPKGLFESYNRIMETDMKKKQPVEAPVVAEVEKKVEEVTLYAPKKIAYIPEMHDKTYDTMEAFVDDMKMEMKKIMASDMNDDEKCEAITSMLVPADLDVKAEAIDNEKAAHLETDDMDADDKKAAESFIRKSDKVGFKMLLEELDSYRLRDEQSKLLTKVHQFCKNSGLNDKLVTEAFVDVLCSVSEDKWKQLVEDRKIIATAKSPISYAAESISGATELTVDSLMKALRS